MNFLYVENFLTNCLGHSPEFIVDQIKKLITEVKEHRSRELNSGNIQDALATLHDHQVRYNNLLEKNIFVVKEGTDQQKIDIIKEILFNLSVLDNYIIDILGRKDLKALSSTSSDGSYIRQLLAEKELYKSEKFMYSDIIREITSENKNKEILYRIELEKLKLNS